MDSYVRLAVSLGKTRIVEIFLDGGMKITGESKPLLHLAVANDDINMVKLLLERGVDANEVDNKTGIGSVLHRACRVQNPNPDIIEILLKHNSTVNALDSDHETPLNLLLLG